MSVSPEKFVNVNANFEPVEKPVDGFVHFLLIGKSPNLPVGNSLKLYKSMQQISNDFGGTDPEYQAASIYFQNPSNNGNVFIGRWFKENTPGEVLGINYEANLNKWTSISDGACTLNAATPIVLSSLDFTKAISLYDVASVLQIAIEASSAANKPTFTFDGKEFRLELATQTEKPYFFTPGASGTDISGMLGMSSDKKPIMSTAMSAEDEQACLIRLRKLSYEWNCYSFAPAFAEEQDPSVPDTSAIKASAFANGRDSVYFISLFGTEVINELDNSSIAYQINQLKDDSTAMFYGGEDASLPNIYTDVSMASVATSVNYDQYDTYITSAYKTATGVNPVDIDDEQFDVLVSKNVNANVISGGRVWNQTGLISDGHYIGQVMGIIYFKKSIQNAILDVLGTSLTIPQNEAGMTKVISIIHSVCARMVSSGFLSPGVWRGGNIGKIKTGDTLTQGFYIYSDPIATQPQADRDARKAPNIYILAKGAGSLQFFKNINLNYEA